MKPCKIAREKSEFSTLVDYETIEKTVACNFEYDGKKWNLMPNKELFNVLSGNLYDYCANLGKNTIEELAGGKN